MRSKGSFYGEGNEKDAPKMQKQEFTRREGSRIVLKIGPSERWEEPKSSFCESELEEEP